MSIGPNFTPVTPEPKPASAGVKMPLFAGVALALLAGTGYEYTQVENLKKELADTRTSMHDELEKLRDSSLQTLQTSKQNISKLSDDLEATRRQAQMATGQAKAELAKRHEQLAKQLAEEEQRRAQAQAAVKTELDSVKDTATTASAKLTEVSTEVGSVKTEVAATKSELDKTIADLKRVNGDVTGQSVLIATNSTELKALRALGERNYFEFKLPKAKEPQKVGDVMVQLKKADPKHNRFTIELVADDKKVEKKDKTVNEAIQFYVARARQPYEIVVNEVRKDQIGGYLSVPKVQTARN